MSNLGRANLLFVRSLALVLALVAGLASNAYGEGYLATRVPERPDRALGTDDLGFGRLQ
jgi:hypothetical protein